MAVNAEGEDEAMKCCATQTGVEIMSALAVIVGTPQDHRGRGASENDDAPRQAPCRRNLTGIARPCQLVQVSRRNDPPDSSRRCFVFLELKRKHKLAECHEESLTCSGCFERSMCKSQTSLYV